MKWSDKRESARESLAKGDAEPVTLDVIDDADMAKLAISVGHIDDRG